MRKSAAGDLPSRQSLEVLPDYVGWRNSEAMSVQAMKHAVRFEFCPKELQHLSGCIEGIGQHAADVRVIRPPPIPVSETGGVVALRQSRTSLPLLQLLQPHPVQSHVEAAGTVQQDHRSPLYDL